MASETMVMRDVDALRLERAQAALAAGRMPAPDDLRWLLTLSPAGVLPQRTEAAEELLEMRRLVVEFAQACGLPAGEIHKRINRYESSAWARERLADECPPHRRGRAEEFCWKILRAYGRAPSERMLRQIIANKKTFGQVKRRNGRQARVV